MAADPVAESLNGSPRVVAFNVLAGYLSLGLSSLLGFITTPLLLHGLGTARFGLYSLVVAATGYLSLLELGLGTTTLTRVAAREHEGSGAISEILSSARALYVLVISVSAVPLVILALFSNQVFHASHHDRTQLLIAVLLAGGWQFLVFLQVASTAGLIGTGRQYVTTLAGLAVGTVTTIGQVIVARFSGGLIWVTVVLAMGAGATLYVQSRQFHRVLPDVQVSTRFANRAMSKDLFVRSWRNGVAQTAGVLAFGSDVLLVGLLLNPTAAATYAIAQKASLLVRTLATKVVDVLTPVYAHAGQKRSLQEQFALYADAVMAAWLLALPAAVVLVEFGSPLLNLWLGHAPHGAGKVLLLLGIVLAIQMPGHNAFILFQGLERLKMLSQISTFAAAFNVLLSVSATLTYGLTGPAIGSLVAVIVFDVAIFPYLVCAELEQPFSAYFTQVLGPAVAPLAVAASVGAFFRASFHPHGLAVLPVCLLVGLAFWAAWWLFAASRRHKDMAFRVGRRLRTAF